MSEKVAKQLSPKRNGGHVGNLRCANDSLLETCGKILVKVQWGEVVKEIEFVIVKTITPEIIGGVELQKAFNIKNEQICNVNAKFGQKISDKERYHKAVEMLQAKDDVKLQKIIKEQ